MKTNGLVDLKVLTIAATLLATSAFAKGRVQIEKVITEPTTFGELVIAPGTIRVFQDNGDLAHGSLHHEQNIHGIVFKTGTRVSIPDYPLSFAHQGMILEGDDNLTVNGIPFGTWIEFTEHPQSDSTEVMTNLVANAHLLGVDVAPQAYLRYECSYTDCSSIARLTDFTLAKDFVFQGISVPAGSRINTSLSSIGLTLSRDVEAQGLFLKGADQFATVYINQFGRVIQFNASRTFMYRGIEIPSGHFVRLDHDGKILQVGNVTFP